MQNQLISSQVQFQFTHPGGVRHLLISLIGMMMTFQFTHPGGVRLLRCVKLATMPMFQFTHPGGVRRMATLTDTLRREVSIHAPGRGATKGYCRSERR